MKNKGFTLIEIMAAIFVMTVGIVGLYALATRIISTTAVNIDRFTASELAKEGVELVRNIRDANWLEGIINPDNVWNEGLTNCSLLGCEADYTAPTVEDPVLVSYGDEGRFLYIEGNSGFYKYIDSPLAGDIKTKFKRKITITPNADILDIAVEVYWLGKGSPLEVKEKLYNWR